jgi:hypothetical protein
MKLQVNLKDIIHDHIRCMSIHVDVVTHVAEDIIDVQEKNHRRGMSPRTMRRCR